MNSFFFFMLAFKSIIFALSILKLATSETYTGRYWTNGESVFFFSLVRDFLKVFTFGLWLLWRNICFYKCKSDMEAFDMWLGISALDFLVNSSSHVQKKVEWIEISSSSGQNYCDAPGWGNGTNWKKTPCHSWGSGTELQTVLDIWSCGCSCWPEEGRMQWEEGASIHSTVPDVLYCRQVWLGQKNVLGACYHPGCGWLVGGMRGDHTTAFCVSNLQTGSVVLHNTIIFKLSRNILTSKK